MLVENREQLVLVVVVMLLQADCYWIVWLVSLWWWWVETETLVEMWLDSSYNVLQFALLQVTELSSLQTAREPQTPD